MTRTAKLGHGPILAAALAYAGRGWRVFPLLPFSQKPYGGTHGVKDATAEKRRIRHWWTETPDANIGLACGIDSGIFAVDTDPRHSGDVSLSKLVQEHGDLPATPRQQTPGGGYHYLFAHTGGRVHNSTSKIAAGIDIKGDGGYIVAAPSRRRDGVYRWIDPPASTPVAPAPAWLLALLDGSPSGTERRMQFSVSLSLCPKSVEDAIEASLPSDGGQRHRRIFLFARMLKALPECRDLEAHQLKPSFARWFERARPIVNTKDFAESWGDFCIAWPRVIHPAGTGPMSDIITRAKKATLPKCARQYDSASMRLLVKLCRELQRAAGDKPFHLSARLAAESIGAPRMTAHRYLAALLADGVIALAEPGTKTKAARYRFIAGAKP